jgi:hypothetical protein
MNNLLNAILIEAAFTKFWMRNADDKFWHNIMDWDGLLVGLYRETFLNRAIIIRSESVLEKAA